MANEPNPTDQNEPDHIKDLRERAGRTDAVQGENDSLKRELAFTRAGIDTTSKPAQAMIHGYAGDLTNEAITAEAAEWNLLPTPAASTPAGEGEPAPQQFGAGSPEAQHQQVAGGLNGQPAPIPDAPVVAGDVEALERYKTNREAGMNEKTASTIAAGDLIRAGMDGRAGARFDPVDWATKADAVGHGAEFAN